MLFIFIAECSRRKEINNFTELGHNTLQWNTTTTICMKYLLHTGSFGLKIGRYPYSVHIFGKYDDLKNYKNTVLYKIQTALIGTICNTQLDNILDIQVELLTSL